MNHHQHEMRRRRIEDCRVRLRRFHRNTGSQITGRAGKIDANDAGSLSVVINDSPLDTEQIECEQDVGVEAQMAGEARS